LGFQGNAEEKKPIEVPWTDADWLFHFTPLVLEFREPFKEELHGGSRFSDKIKLSSVRITGSVVRLSRTEASNYLEPIIQEKRDELGATAQYLGRGVVVEDLLREVAKGPRLEVELDEADTLWARQMARQRAGGQRFERIQTESENRGRMVLIVLRGVQVSEEKDGIVVSGGEPFDQKYKIQDESIFNTFFFCLLSLRFYFFGDSPNHFRITSSSATCL